MLKKLIIIFISIFAIIDLIIVFAPRIKKWIEKCKRKKRQKAFGRKMKDLEIKWMNLIRIAISKKCLTKNCIWGIYNEGKNIRTLF